MDKQKELVKRLLKASNEITKNGRLAKANYIFPNEDLIQDIVEKYNCTEDEAVQLFQEFLNKL